MQVQGVPVLGVSMPTLKSQLDSAAPPLFDMRPTLEKASAGRTVGGMPGSLSLGSMLKLFGMARDIIGSRFAVTDVGARDGRALMIAMYCGADNAHGPDLESFYCVDGPRRVGSIVGQAGDRTGFGPRFLHGRNHWAKFLTESVGVPTHPMSMHIEYGCDVITYDKLSQWPSPPLFGGRNLPRVVFQFDALFEERERVICYKLSNRDASVKVVMTTWKDAGSVSAAELHLGPEFVLHDKVGVSMRSHGQKRGEGKTVLVFKRVTQD